MLNYAYAVLKGQCRTALLSLGFDVACGLLHAEKAGRDSRVYDLMEPCRPLVDGLLLDVLRKTTFGLGDFIRRSDGACRLHPQLARFVVASCRRPDATVHDHARRPRSALLNPMNLGSPAPMENWPAVAVYA
jgi:CRISPR/Cas system-associated endonuclease Cas1